MTQNNNNTRSSKAKRITLKTLIYILGSCFLIWIISGVTLWFVFKPGTNGGVFGDMFGVINALFSGLAFGGVIYAILLQKSELKVSMDSLSKSASAQAESSKALINQSDIMLKTARLNALSSLLSDYTNKKDDPEYAIFNPTIMREKREGVVKEIEVILTSMNNE